MPRQPRFEYPGASYHVMCRGNRGEPIFEDDGDREMFLATLVEAKVMMGWKIHAYVLMSNHYHLLLETPEPNLVAGMKWFQGTYTQRYNARHKTRGHLFQGRYKSVPVQVGKGDSVYFRTVSNYIHLNPFRANLCGVGKGTSLESYPWSSYPHYIGVVPPPKWLTCSAVFKTHGLPGSGEAATQGYRAILQKRMIGQKNLEALWQEEEILKQIRRGWYVGTENFRDLLVEGSQEQAPGDNHRGEFKRLHDQAGAESLLEKGLEVLGISEEAFLEYKPTSIEKQFLGWTLQTHTSVTIQWISERLQMGHRTNASKNIRSFRERKDEEAMKLKQYMNEFTG